MPLVYDKKQLPQVIGLGAVSAGLLGYFCIKMITPPPTQAASTQQAGAKTPGSAASTATGATESTATGPDAGALLGAAPPTDAMRDPFAAPPMPVAAPVQVASAKIPAPSPIPGLPSVGQVSPLPIPAAAPPIPVWEVTGVIRSDMFPQESVAIFRSGTDRRYVRLGEMVDSATRLIGIDRDGVTISRSGQRIRLALGGPPRQSTPAPGQGSPVVGQVPAPASAQSDTQTATQTPDQAPTQTASTVDDPAPAVAIPNLPALATTAPSAPAQPTVQAPPAGVPTF